MNLLVYTDSSEPLTQFLIKYKNELNVSILSLKEVIDKAEIFDEFDENGCEIEWNLEGFPKIHNSENVFLINRALFLPSEWFNQFDEKDKNYAINEFWAYFLFALSAFPKTTDLPGYGCLSGSSFPLNSQWEKVSQQFGVQTPEFYIGPSHFITNEWLNETIFTTPYQLYSWKINTCENKPSSFVIRKPAGFPILTFNIKEEILIFTYEEKIEKKIEEMIVFQSKKIHEHFGFFCSEILFFCSEEEICFCMINHLPWAAFQSEKTHNLLMKVFRKILI